MNHSFKIDRRFNDEDQYLYTYGEIDFRHPVTVLVGCNGSGNTTLIEQICNRLRSQNFQEKGSDFGDALMRAMRYTKKEPSGIYLSFNKKANFARGGESGLLMSHVFESCMSNGEGVTNKMCDAAVACGQAAKEAKEKNIPIWYFFDDCDAGTSIDAIKDMKAFFLTLSKDLDENGIEYRIVITSNSFEMCRDFPCVYVKNGKELKFGSYEEFARFVLKSRKEKDDLDKRARKRKESKKP